MAHIHAHHDAPPKQRVLLPTDVKPIVYRLHLTPDLAAFTFAGTADIDLSVINTTKKVSFHGLELELTAASISVAGGAPVDVISSLSYNKADEVFTLDVPELRAGTQATLSIKYKGTLNDKMSGFYRSRYTVNGEQRWMATSQFEPVDARKAIPCWDEPAVKAQFEVTLTCPSHMTALSNMPAIETVTDGATKTKTVKFDRTPIMSTYLLAFLVGEFDYVESRTRDGVTMRVFTPIGQSEKGKFALDVGAKVLQYFSDYFAIPYPLPKQDMVAIPDFAAGAMENWGLITYRETALLCDENSSVSARARVAYVVAHELAHQWFGNLVTMEWWKELWLNEGFATYIGNQAVDVLFPQWNMWTMFVSQYLFNALRLDALLSSHPIEVEVYRSRDIDEIFDAISYSKGASVIRMLATYLGEAAFQKGLQIYLNRHKYTNATTQDLWTAWSEASGQDVSKIMHHWTKDVGYPVLQVERKTEKGCKLAVNQTRYLSSGQPTQEQDQTVWWIKVPIQGEHEQNVTFLDFSSKDAELDLAPSFEKGWIKVNAGQSGVFRVAYGSGLSAALNPAIETLSLSPSDRLGLQNDAFALAKAGYIQLSQALILAKSFTNETDYTVWSDLSANLSYVASVFEGEDFFPKFQNYTRQLYEKIGASLGWDPKAGQTDLDKLLRSVVLAKLGDNGDASVVAEAKKRFEAFKADPNSLPADLRSVVLKFVMRNGGAAEFDEMVNLYKTAQMPEDKINALRAIGLSRDSALIQKALDYILDGEVRNQDAYILIAACASTPVGRKLTWQFVKTNWDVIVQRFSGGMAMVGAFIKFSVDGFATEEAAADVEEFFKTHKADGTERTIAQCIESIKSNAAWLKRNADDIRKFLESNGY